MRSLSLSVLLLAACSDGETPRPPSAVPPIQEDQAALVDGPALYSAYCASCHGESGDGQGPAQLDRPARSFKDGGFSFGNTIPALKRTIAVGIAGSPMPGFGSALNDEQLTALAAHVRALGPETIPDAGDAAIVVVGDRPSFVRGQLPSLTEGQPDLPRGLLVGTPDGLSWQYDLQTMQLLAVRQGEFVERTDWVGRGGTPLKPLGRVVDVPASDAGAFHDETGARLETALLSTRVESDRAILSYALVDSSDRRVAIVRESGHAVQLESCSGYARRWTVERVAGRVDTDLRFSIAGESDVLGEVDTSATRWHRSTTEYGIRLHGVSGSMSEVRADVTWVSIPAGAQEVSFAVTTLLPPDATPDTLAKITEELNR